VAEIVPAYIRYFACTDSSAVGALALAFCKSMLKIAPVRLAVMSGVLMDDWLSYAHLTSTPMVGSFVNVVACDPARWTWLLRVPMPEKDAWQSAVSDVNVNGMGVVEFASERQSLYTAHVRNVLYAVAPPRSRHELKVALQFESIVVPNEEHRKWWEQHGERITRVIGYPILDSAVREEICGT
jgi:hypothetical protein